MQIYINKQQTKDHKIARKLILAILLNAYNNQTSSSPHSY